MVSVLCIDIGLLNLSFCVVTSGTNVSDISGFEINLWEVYNTLPIKDQFCQEIQKNKKICNKKCSFKNSENEITTFYCKKHFPKNIEIKKKHKFAKKKISSFTLQDIALIFLEKIQNIYTENESIFKSIDKIFIELQPNCARKMIFVSHILYGKFIELYKDTKVSIKFVRASQKLKSYTGPFIECHLKSPYAKRKWLSIRYCEWFLENKFSKEQKELWLPKFLDSKKKDDLGDVKLMCINAICGIPKTKQKNGEDIK